MTTAAKVDTSKIQKGLEGSQGTGVKPGMTLRALIQTSAVRQRFEQVLGKKAAGFMSSIITATQLNPKLLACDPYSVLSAAAIAATLDLPINPSLGMAHIVPYRDVAQFQIGAKGFVQLAMRSGQYLTMNQTEVHEGEIVSNNRFSGIMELDEAKRTSNKVVGYLFYFKLLNGFEKWTYMTTEQVETHGKRYSQAYKQGFGPWVENFSAMALKTVVKAGLSKWGILSIEMQRAIETDQAVIKDDGTPEYIDAPPETEKPAESSTPVPAEAKAPDTVAEPAVITERQLKRLHAIRTEAKVSDASLATFLANKFQYVLDAENKVHVSKLAASDYDAVIAWLEAQ